MNDHDQFMPLLQGVNSVSFSEGIKGPLSVFFFFFYCSVELISALAQYTTLAASSSLSILLVRHCSHGYYCGWDVQIEPRYCSRHTKQILFMLTACLW